MSQTSQTSQTSQQKVKKVEKSEHPVIDKLRAELGAIEMDVLTSYTLADAIREGASMTRIKVGGFIEGNAACAFGNAYLAGRARGFIEQA